MKLQQGDYTEDLTKEQWDELIKIEANSFKLTYPDLDISSSELLKNGLCYYEELLDHSWVNQCKTKLSFTEFKQLAINTFEL